MRDNTAVRRIFKANTCYIQTINQRFAIALFDTQTNHSEIMIIINKVAHTHRKIPTEHDEIPGRIYLKNIDDIRGALLVYIRNGHSITFPFFVDVSAVAGETCGMQYMRRCDIRFKRTIFTWHDVYTKHT